MNKKIKVIELLNKIANKEKVPKKIKWQDNIYEYDFEDNSGYARMDFSVYQFLTDDLALDTFKDLNDYVEILEDNTEEIEELKEISDGYFNMLSDEAKVKWLKSYIKEDRNKINELVKAVNEMRKKMIK